LSLPTIGNRILKQVPELYFLGLEIFLVVRIRGRANWHLLDHLEAITFQSDHFFGIVGQEAEVWTRVD